MSRCGALTAGIVALSLAGCSYTPPVELIPVRGVIKVQGKPLPAGRVIFAPAAGMGHEGRGAVDADGSYQVTMDGAPPDKTGMPAGKYHVLVFAIRPSTPESGMKPPEWLANPRYADAKTSQLSVDVPSAGEGAFDLTLDP